MSASSSDGEVDVDEFDSDVDTDSDIIDSTIPSNALNIEDSEDF